jgi:uncharacterized membrane protein YhaH (DUF805 family)
MQTLSSIIGFRGRATRRHFWVAHAIGKLIFVAALIGASSRLFKNGIQNTPTSEALEAVPEVAPMLIVAYIASAIIGLTAAGRRLHDRDKPATWLILFFAPVSIILAALIFGGWLTAYQLVGSLPFAIAANVINFWYYFELGLMKGTDGPNRYDTAATRGNASDSTGDNVTALAGAGAAMEAAIQRHKAAQSAAAAGVVNPPKQSAHGGFGRRATR